MGGVTDAIGGLFGSGKGAADDAADAQVQANRDNIQFQQQLFNALQGINSYQTGIGNQALGLYGSMYGLTPGYNPAGSYSFGGPSTSGTPTAPTPTPGAPAPTQPGVPGLYQPPGPTPSQLGPYGSGSFGNVLGQVFQNNQSQPGSNLQYTPPGPAPANAPDPNNFAAFYQSPDYMVARDEALDATNSAFGANGGLFSGARAAGLQDNASKVGSQYFGNYMNRLASLAGIGQTGTAATGNALQNAGQNIGNSLLNQGDARASGYLGKYQAGQNALNNWLNVGSMFL